VGLWVLLCSTTKYSGVLFPALLLTHLQLLAGEWLYNASQCTTVLRTEIQTRGESSLLFLLLWGGGLRELVMKNRIPPTADIMYVLRTDLSLLEARLLSNTPVVPSLLDMEKHRETRETSLQKAKGQRGADLSL
jgi:hypothetical protein